MSTHIYRTQSLHSLKYIYPNACSTPALGWAGRPCPGPASSRGAEGSGADRGGSSGRAASPDIPEGRLRAEAGAERGEGGSEAGTEG